ncbi:MAG: SDR family NAD(P)-dependent oxidoreductase [Rhodobacteraceae bacterium]|nr:SDR family NAD(P)-dependent oxidoreductase [Paracoccaceae bacterium]
MTRVMITGANRGIGAALASAYASRGDHVIATARNATGLPDLDVTSPSSHRALASTLGGERIDTLICNAGVYLDKHQTLSDGYSEDMWAKSFAVNVTGVFLTVQSFLSNVQLSDRPRIAIISSQMGSDTRAPGGSYIYRASKAAALNLGRNLATDLKHLKIAVGIYHPGWVTTDMGGSNAEITPDAAAHGLIERIDALTVENTGCFETWDGRAHPY